MSYKIKISYVHVPLSLNDWRQLKTMIFHMFDFANTLASVMIQLIQSVEFTARTKTIFLDLLLLLAAGYM